MTKILDRDDIERSMDEECGPICKHGISLFKDCLSCDYEKKPRQKCTKCNGKGCQECDWFGDAQ